MAPNPCAVCGGTDLNMIDGFYYCVECGTQNKNAQDIVVERVQLADGSAPIHVTTKVRHIRQDAFEMSPEWHKWHTFNFILRGLVEEMKELGVSPTFPDKVLFIWTRYMKEFMDKDQMKNNIDKKNAQIDKSIFNIDDDDETSSPENQTSKVDVEIAKKTSIGYRVRRRNEHSRTNEDDNSNNSFEENEAGHSDEGSDDDFEEWRGLKYGVIKRLKKEKDRISEINTRIFLAILYLALNFDKSDIQLSHLLRFVKEHRLSLYKGYRKLIPKEMNVKSIPHWDNYLISLTNYRPCSPLVQKKAIQLVRVLKLNKPLVPDLRKIVDNYMKELCLPNDFKNLVFALMHHKPIPIRLLDLNYKPERVFAKMPDYEGIVMSYVLVALKMTFGLDDNYDTMLSDAVDKINQEDNRLKSYKLGSYSQNTDRLFSFREWSKYLIIRKIILSKYYLPIAQKYELSVDDRTFLDQVEERNYKRKILISDEITMNILNKIPLTSQEESLVPKSEFVPTLTPMANYTDILLKYIKDPELILVLGEDFTQYSLKYACKDLKLLVSNKNIIEGISMDNKSINENIIGKLKKPRNKSFRKMVFVKNCKNKNWQKTKPPKLEHITEIESDDSDHDCGYDSNLDNSPEEVQNQIEIENNDECRQLHIIKEEEEGISIFDDPFDDIAVKLEIPEELEEDTNVQPDSDVLDVDHPNISVEKHNEPIFEPDKFDREKAIKELVLSACRKLKVPVTKDTKQTRKSRKPFVNESGDVAVPVKIPKKNIQKGKFAENQKKRERIMAIYCENLKKYIEEEVSKHVASTIDDIIKTNTNHFDTNNSTSNVNKNGDLSIANEAIQDQTMKEINKCETNTNHFNNNDSTLNVNENGDSSIADEAIQDQTMEEINKYENEDDVSVMEVDNEEITVDKYETDPKFDEEIYDIGQLYVKCNEALEINNVLVGELEPDSILESKIKEGHTNDLIQMNSEELQQHLENKSDSNEQMFDDSYNVQCEPTDNLISNPDQIEQFQYWLRHYEENIIGDGTHNFDKELNEELPKSFSFILRECASILSYRPDILYRYMMQLERNMFKYKRVQNKYQILR